ncbi:MAG: radical SAM protein [Bacteroides sp.]|nr:radical SAM protein [Bacteroides sp.]
MKENVKQVFGTYEWAVENANFINGCSNNCKYCYSREMAIRFKRKTSENWSTEEINYNQFNKKIKKVDGFIMFPSSHDITPVNLPSTIIFLKKLLEAKNNILIVSKPHFEVIQSICNNFSQYKKHILFRFTIGSKNNETLNFWEPGAPNYEERKRCLIYAYENGFETSISCEPMLDRNTVNLISDLQDYVTDFIWIGKANFLLRRLTMNGITDSETIERAEKLMNSQSDSNIKMLYRKLKDNPKIKWKESIKRVLNLEISTVKGLDE